MTKRASSLPEPQPAPSVGVTENGRGAKRDLATDLARTELLEVAVSPRALRLLTNIARHQDTTCEALVRRYLSTGMVEDRKRMLAEVTDSIIQDVLAELAPDQAEAAIVEVRRRIRELAAT